MIAAFPPCFPCTLFWTQVAPLIYQAPLLILTCPPGSLQIELKGRVPVAKLDTFLVELRRSKNRTVTAALLRPADEATPDERAVLKDVSVRGGVWGGGVLYAGHAAAGRA